MDEKFVKANNLLLDPSFVEELGKKENDVEVQALFAAHGVQLELADIEKMCKEAVANCASLDGELNENDLEVVSGGVVGCFCLGAALIAFFTGYAKTKYGR